MQIFVISIAVLFIGIVILASIFANRANREPDAILNRAVGLSEEPSDEIKKFDRNFVIKGSRELLQSPDEHVIIDTETTGLDKSSEIIQIAAIDPNGVVLINTLVKPSKRKRWPKAEGIHGITPAMVKDAPSFADIRPKLVNILKTRQAMTYNANFDRRLLDQSANAIGCPAIDGKVVCAMALYSMFMGQWNHKYGHYKWHKLGGDHTALGDCQATLKLIKRMASA